MVDYQNWELPHVGNHYTHVVQGGVWEISTVCAQCECHSFFVHGDNIQKVP